jgi:hypothetical protein
MVLLVPTVLHTSTGTKTVAMGLDLAGHQGARTHDGPLTSIIVYVNGNGFRIDATMKSTDVRSEHMIEETRQVRNLENLREYLTNLKEIDETQTRLTLVPSPDNTTGQIVLWMDAIRMGPHGELFPHVTLGAAS